MSAITRSTFVVTRGRIVAALLAFACALAAFAGTSTHTASAGVTVERLK
jgi:hypothetical protein